MFDGVVAVAGNSTAWHQGESPCGEVGNVVALSAPTEAIGWERVVEYFDLFGATIDINCAPSYFRVGFPFAGAS